MIKYLGVIFTEFLNFNKHMDYITAKAFSMLGFIKRIGKDFRNVTALKAIYLAHVRSHLEYASVVWSPYYQTHVDRIESIQKKFLTYAPRRSLTRDMNYRLPSYVSRCESIGLETLVRQRLNLIALINFDLLNGRIDASSLNSKLRLVDYGRDLRQTYFLYVRTNYGTNELSNCFEPES